MNNLSKIKVSLWARFSTSLFMVITPEYYEFKKVKRKDRQKTLDTVNYASIPFQNTVIEGVKIRYAHEGQSDKPCIILLSPLPQSIYAYTPIWGKLIEKYNVYAYDMPGFGRSEGSEEDMHFAKQGKFLKSFIEHFKIKKPHIIGPDIGMAAALNYVTNFPNEVESLLIGDGPGVSPSKNGSLIKKLERSSFWRLVFKVVGAETFVYAACKLCYVNYQPSQKEVDDYIASYKNRIGQTTKWFKYYSEGMATIDPYLEQIPQPVLIFWGGDDKLLLPENASNMHAKLKNSKLNIFENCGHFSYQDKHSEFAELVDNWVSKDYKTTLKS